MTKFVGLEVQKRMCATCIYRPDSCLNLTALEDKIKDPYMDDFFKGSRICHHSEAATCRGFWNKHKDHFAAGQVAQRLGYVEFVEHNTLRGGI